MNATSFITRTAAVLFVGLAAVGCAHKSDDAMERQARAPMAVEPVVVVQPAPVVAYVAPPAPMEVAIVEPVIVKTEPPVRFSSADYAKPDKMITERAPRADRN